MRIKSTDFIPANYYHIYNRAAQSLLLFKNAEDYQKCLSLMNRYMDSPDFSMVAFCLMPNHYHFFMHQNGECPIYMIMNKIWFSYSKYYNRKYGGKGSIFAGKTQHKHVDKDAYLLRLPAYIHQNPVTAELVSSPEQWEWSNYLEWVGLRDAQLCDFEIIRSYYDDESSYSEMMDVIASEKQIKSYMLD
ncbi:MAG: transposase [Candidatus Cloacimonetes bacterium]|nr:transposase [Candidatus Cloacimonadota bacterium]